MASLAPTENVRIEIREIHRLVALDFIYCFASIKKKEAKLNGSVFCVFIAHTEIKKNEKLYKYLHKNKLNCKCFLPADFDLLP